MAKAPIIVRTKLVARKLSIFSEPLFLVEHVVVGILIVSAHLARQNMSINALVSLVALPRFFEKLTNGQLLLNLFMQEVAFVLFLTVALEPEDANLLFGFAKIFVAVNHVFGNLDLLLYAHSFNKNHGLVGLLLPILIVIIITFFHCTLSIIIVRESWAFITTAFMMLV